MFKSNKIVFIALGACFLSAPLYFTKVISIGVVKVIFLVALVAIALSVTGIFGKLFNKK